MEKQLHAIYGCGAVTQTATVLQPCEEMFSILTNHVLLPWNLMNEPGFGCYDTFAGSKNEVDGGSVTMWDWFWGCALNPFSSSDGNT